MTPAELLEHCIEAHLEQIRKRPTPDVALLATYCAATSVITCVEPHRVIIKDNRGEVPHTAAFRTMLEEIHAQLKDTHRDHLRAVREAARRELLARYPNHDVANDISWRAREPR